MGKKETSTAANFGPAPPACAPHVTPPTHLISRMCTSHVPLPPPFLFFSCSPTSFPLPSFLSSSVPVFHLSSTQLRRDCGAGSPTCELHAFLLFFFFILFFFFFPKKTQTSFFPSCLFVFFFQSYRP